MLNENEKQLYKEISEILWNEWDPIGVNDGNLEFDDEYNAYIPQIHKLAMEDQNKDVIANQLSFIVKERMELTPSEDHSKNVASLIIEAKKRIIG